MTAGAEIPGCFKAYDIRGRVPDEVNPQLAESLGRILVDFFDTRLLVVGHDIRLSSPALAEALIAGINRAGADVLFIGRCGTEEMYFTVGTHDAGGGVMITASHNPAEYNGMKIVAREARPVSDASGLREIGRRVACGECPPDAPQSGRVQHLHNRQSYAIQLLQHIDPRALRPLKLLVDAGNGGAGEIIDRLEGFLPFTLVRLRHQPDGRFPHGVPNPMLEQNRRVTAEAVRSSGADLGLAWDGDFDRCFFFDENGTFIESYYLVGLLAEYFLARNPQATVICDNRLVWNTEELVQAAGGKCVHSKAGHSFIKEAMRRESAVYGGEMSGHHYFRDFFHCDSGMLPWLFVTEILGRNSKPLSTLVAERMQRFPISGEISRRVTDVAAVVDAVRGRYEAAAESSSELDGISFSFPEWRFNLRPSNTEPLLRLNVESRGNTELVREKTAELLQLMGGDAT